MYRKICIGVLILYLIISISAEEDDFSGCNCEDEGWWSVESIMHCQKVSDFLIAIAYFSIPIELLYFISCSNVPFKWVLSQFTAFIVLCGLTHLLNGWTYGQHPFQLMLALTIFKFLTALVSCATAITLITLIPLLLKVKKREFFLKKKAWELDREVEMMKQQKEASLHVRMLTREIRKSLDRHTILDTTLVELSKTLGLQNCAVWMPNGDRTEMQLTHELKEAQLLVSSCVSIPYNDLDVRRLKEEKGVKLLQSDSALGRASVGDGDEPGPVAAIRMPMLRVSDFKGGTPELIPQCYAILVLILPNSDGRDWSYQDLEIIEVVADQVAVALSHAAVLEESQHMRDQLVEKNRALQQARKDAMMANKARNSFQKVMSHGMRRPMHSILGLLSMVQHEENLGTEQKTIIDTMVKTSTVLSNLINDVMEISNKDSGRFPLELRSFGLHSMIREAGCLVKCLCVYSGFSFEIEVESTLPDRVISDEGRIFQVILHMIGNLLNASVSGGFVHMRVVSDSANANRDDQRWAMWVPSSSGNHTYIKFEFSLQGRSSQLEGLILSQSPYMKHSSEGIDGGLSFTVCKKLVRTMQGNIWVVPDSLGQTQSMGVVLRLQHPQSGGGIFDFEELAEPPPSNSLFRGLQVLLVDEDVVNRAVTRKLLERLGCKVASVSSGLQCLGALGPAGTPYHIVLLDLNVSDMDGFDVAVRIRKFGSRSWPLIVALTASGDEDVIERCRQMGINGVIRKPVLLQGIADELRKVLQQANRNV